MKAATSKCCCNNTTCNTNVWNALLWCNVHWHNDGRHDQQQFWVQRNAARSLRSLALHFSFSNWRRCSPPFQNNWCWSSCSKWTATKQWNCLRETVHACCRLRADEEFGVSKQRWLRNASIGNCLQTNKGRNLSMTKLAGETIISVSFEKHVLGCTPISWHQKWSNDADNTCWKTFSWTFTQVDKEFRFCPAKKVDEQSSHLLKTQFHRVDWSCNDKNHMTVRHKHALRHCVRSLPPMLFAVSCGGSTTVQWTVELIWFQHMVQCASRCCSGQCWARQCCNHSAAQCSAVTWQTTAARHVACMLTLAAAQWQWGEVSQVVKKQLIGEAFLLEFITSTHCLFSTAKHLTKGCLLRPNSQTQSSFWQAHHNVLNADMAHCPWN